MDSQDRLYELLFRQAHVLCVKYLHEGLLRLASTKAPTMVIFLAFVLKPPCSIAQFMIAEDKVLVGD